MQIWLDIAGAGDPSCGDHAMLQPLLLAISLLGAGGLLPLHRPACFGTDPGAILAPGVRSLSGGRRPCLAEEHRVGELDQESHLEERRLSPPPEGFRLKTIQNDSFQELCRAIFNGALAFGFLLSGSRHLLSLAYQVGAGHVAVRQPKASTFKCSLRRLRLRGIPFASPWPSSSPT